MADSDQAAAEVNADSREIRVFLSSTFRDFMEERDLLVKQVFPELRRKARDRGVEVVDVDLRWGITEEESRQGKVIPICLGEIDRCRPYFVGMLGERYGWIPPADQYSPQVIERQPWLKDHQGGVSVTELEILHGVLRNPEMAGRAFFYFRDPAWSTSQSEPGFVCETAEEEEKLADLKQRIHSSGFPVAENLPDPKALADQIGHDLWELIEQQYPDLDEADALEREERQHASYRRSRLGVYLGGKRSINQLERWIGAGQQKILITGESGAGKSALIANWIEVHRQNHPEDVVFAHHLGCSNDASAIRPLLARLIDTAKQQLPEIYGYSLSVPQDWWELVAKAVEALQSLGRWAQQNNHRWIWVLDGLDRLDPDDQKALPWLPLTIPEGVVIVASALECPAREILLERKFKTRTIAPLKAKEQDALIKQYLGRYTKQLIAELRQTTLKHLLAGSPLFLRVLLEELRQCGRYKTLADQLNGYLKAKTIDDLYEKVLERLEADGNGENVRKVMTALWASRAGLSEEELLSITGLKPLQWAPIDLALEDALGRNGNRLVFDHDYLRIAVEDRYLPTEEDRRQAHSELADWFATQVEWDPRKAEEWPWQLQQAGRNDDLRKLLNDRRTLKKLASMTSPSSVVQMWSSTRGLDDAELDETIKTVDLRHADENTIFSLGGLELVDSLADLFSCAGLHRSPLIELREKSYSIRVNNKETDLVEILDAQQKLATAMLMADLPENAVVHYKAVLDQALLLFEKLDRRLASTYSNLGNAYSDAGMYEDAKWAYLSAQEIEEEICGENHPSVLCNMNNLAVLSRERGDYELAESLYMDCIKRKKMILGKSHPDTLTSMENLAVLYFHQGRAIEALELAHECYESQVMLHGESHPEALGCMMNLASIYRENEDISKSIDMLYRCLNGTVRLFGEKHPKVQLVYMNLGASFFVKEDYVKAEQYYRQALDLTEMPAENPRRYKLMSELADCMSEQDRHSEAIPLRRQVVMGYKSLLGAKSTKVWSEVHQLATDLLETGELEESRSLFLEELENLSRLLEASDFRIGRVLDSISRSFEMAERLDESAAYWHQALAHWIKYEGADNWCTNSSRYNLARVLVKLGSSSDAQELLVQLKRSMNGIESPDAWDVDLLNRASMLNADIELPPD